MAKRKVAPYPKQLKELLAAKSRLLSQADSLVQMGLTETAQPVWASAASYEERIAPRLEVLGRDAEAALHRISAAACYERCGKPTRAVNLYRAALAGPLPDAARAEVEAKLVESLKRLKREPVESVA